MRVPFNWPHMTGRELDYIEQAHRAGHLAGGGAFTQRCQRWLEGHTGAARVLLTNSCTAALEMAALLTELRSGDEVIMPSYTFVSTANAFVLRGAVPVFVDIREDTLNLNERLVEEAITERTRVIVPVHYAGVGCEMDILLKIVRNHNLLVVEDSAQGLLATYKGRPLGSFGQAGAVSFHETKNVISGEGGALLVNDPEWVELAESIGEKGTDRSRFFRGEIDKYTWQCMGSSFLPSEITAAFLWAQLEEAETLTERRLSKWHAYHERLASLEAAGYLRRPIVPYECQHNGHLYYILLRDLDTRDALAQYLRSRDVYTIFHYVPLHSSPAGLRYGRTAGSLRVTETSSARLLRLPMHISLSDTQIDRVVDLIAQFFRVQAHHA